MFKKKDSDELMLRLLISLSKDFETELGEGTCVKFRENLSQHGLRGYRSVEYPIWDNSRPYFTKCQQQLGNFLKRYRFAKDVFSDTELLDQAKAKFLATQQRISEPIENSVILTRVLSEARYLAKDILGHYDPEEHMTHCRFGKRACYGHSYSKAYLDLKIAGPLTGSRDHISWFKNYLRSDAILSDAITQGAPNGVPQYSVCDTLHLSFVPKSWKSLRSIKPHTLLGSFYTYGLGKLIQKRLERVGLDISHLQLKHREMARINSVSRRLATADLSAASDSITSTLLMKVLPLPWYRAVMHGRTKHVSVDGTRTLLFSVATMGDGHTFPLQTLVFYCLLKAIGNCLMRKTFVSVYGDDLIYPSWLHPYVARIFPLMHLQLNLDKTYVSTHFRESCGGDYHRGVDVRPFSFEGGHQLYSSTEYAQFLYKLYNGLTHRWEACEIPITLDLLLSELALCNGKILQVPPSFPDGSGLKVDRPIHSDMYETVTYSLNQGTWVFKYIHTFPDKRVVSSQFPYYWDSMRSAVNSDISSPWSMSEDVLSWRKTTIGPRYGRSSISNKRIRLLEACVPMKSSCRTKRQTGSTSRWA